MAEMTNLKTLIEHSNEFGDEPVKKVGDTYEATGTAAQALIANGYAEDTKPKAASSRAGKEG
jgi:hypothetical protein